MNDSAPFNPAAARLDNETEAALYDLYRAYFTAHEARQWNVWETIPQTTEYADAPSDALVAAALTCYGAELFLPDYMTTLLMHTRSSRGRTWYVTHWCYEEGKHLLAIGDWLIRRGLYTETELQNRGSELLENNRWHPASIDAIALYADAVLYEAQELTNYRTLRGLAVAENDTILTALCDHIIGDEAAQQAYFVAALRIIRERHAESVDAAIETVVAAHGDADAARDMINHLSKANL
ncbi:MAG: hypothetical protein H7Y38_03675 [Armatimonadetes bacterium]|nr:hypothetical protein [Armatimonadota bacterium]